MEERNRSEVRRLLRLSEELLHPLSEESLVEISEKRRALLSLTSSVLTESDGVADVECGLSLAAAAVAVSSVFPCGDDVSSALVRAASRDLSSYPPDSRKCLLLVYLYGATYSERYREAAEQLLSSLPADALVFEARWRLDGLRVTA